MRHKHADLIHAWAEGAEIECSLTGRNWATTHRPDWNESIFYRIKPEKKPDVVVEGAIRFEGTSILALDYGAEPNLRATFSGENKLLKVEVIKRD